MASDPTSVSVDPETGLEREDTGGGPAAKAPDPFDPSELRIDTRPLGIDLLAQRLADGAIDMAPAIARSPVWDEAAQSRLIESLLIRMPAPAFYFDASNEERWLVVDGLHRLSALDAFINGKTLKLTGLEYLDNLEGKGFEALPRHFQRRILETQVTAHLIQEGTPEAMRFNLFQRLNTSARPLAAGEIRHLLKQGPATALLERLAGGKAFRDAMGDGVAGMAAEECVLRFLAFRLTPYVEYPGGAFEEFLDDAMTSLNVLDTEQLDELEAEFRRALQAARDIFGADAFRKRFAAEDPPAPVNGALFESWAGVLAGLDEDRLAAAGGRAEGLKEGFIKLLNDDGAYVDAISNGTGEPAKIRKRFSEIESLIERMLR